jgi:hypothetical protein
MKRWERLTFNLLSALITLSGVGYFAMKYLMTTDDPFAVVNHPLQPLMLHAHVLVAPAFLVMFGVIWNSHITWKIGQPVPNRWSGLVSLVTLGVMTVSGYLLQVVTSEAGQRLNLVAHLASGVIFAIAYMTHLVVAGRLWVRHRASAKDTVTA